MKQQTSLNRFCIQLNEFCLMFQEEILQLANTPRRPPDQTLALAFAETLILCPTAEAARTSIRRDVAGARSFLVAADAVLKRIRTQKFDFKFEEPQHQTKFYTLACAIDDYLQEHGLLKAVVPDSTCSTAKPNVSKIL